MDQERQAIDTIPAGISWSRGRKITQDVPNPLEVIMDGDGIMVPMFNRGILLFRDDLIAAIQSAGVDNLDLYDSVLIDPVQGVRHRNYKAVNIVGLVAAADLDKSVYSTPSGSALIDTDFDSVVIDEKKARGILMFRMAECVSAIVIHEKVKTSIEKAGIPHLNFIEPENWFG